MTKRCAAGRGSARDSSQLFPSLLNNPLPPRPPPHLVSEQEIEGQKRAKRDRSEQAEEERHARMLREQIERAQKVARTGEVGGDGGAAAAAAADPAATELRREALDQPLGFQLAAGRASAAAATATEQQQARPKPALAFDDDGGGGAGPSGRGAGGKKSKIEELMEKVGSGWAGRGGDADDGGRGGEAWVQ